MRRLLLLPPLLIATACSAAADKSETQLSGKNGTRDFAASGFDAVSLRGPDNVIVKVGPAASVRAEGDTAILDRLEIEVVNGTLRVGREKRDGFRWTNEKGGVVVTVTLPKLRGASIAGSGDMDVDTVDTDSFNGAIAGSGSLRVGSIKAAKADISIAGSGNARIGAGTAESIEVSIAGSGDLDMKAVSSKTADISIAGSGDVKAAVSDSADISIIGSGDVEIVGNAKCDISKMGSGDVRCGVAASADK